MGYDPYWPTCLASVNVLCVPAVTTTPSRFDEIFRALSSVNHVDLEDLADGEDLGNDLINASDFRRGVAFLDYSKESGSARVERFPMEPNAVPQVVLGIYDATHSSDAVATDDETKGAEADDLMSLSQRLEATFSKSRGDRLCILLAIGQETTSAGAVIASPSLDQAPIYNAVKLVYKSLVTHLCAVTESLTNLEFLNPSLPAPSNSQPEQHINGSPSPLQADQHPPENSSQEVRKGRYTFVIGLLNLYAGAWPDAMRRLAEGAMLGRENGDSLWQARALECLLVCMLLLAWRGIDFDVPEVCEQAYNASQMMSRSSMFARPASIALPSQAKSEADLAPIQKWSKYSPVVAQAILSVYSSLASTMGQQLPPTLVTESRIRVINLLIFSSNEVTSSQRQALDLFILRREHPASSIKSSTYASTTSIGANIPTLLLESLPSSNDGLADPDHVAATIAIVSALSSLGSLRRHAFTLRNLLQRLAPTLMRARKVGASEAGVHPESAFAVTSNTRQTSPGEPRTGLRPLLQATTSAYGIAVPESVSSQADEVLSKSRVTENLSSWCQHHFDGDILLKIDVLLQCISVCDALPDPSQGLLFTSTLLRLSIQSVTISTVAPNSPPHIPAKEQSRLLEFIKRTADPGRTDANMLRAPYWDDFLVRDVQVFQPPGGSTLNSHAPSELSLADDQSSSSVRDPFIFNPFARNTTIQAAPVVVAGEIIVFTVLLQNPLEAEVDITDIALAAEGCDFEPGHHSLVLGPSCAQHFTLTGKGLKSGFIKIIGCTATVAGCHSQTFPIFKSEWRTPLRVKQTVSNSGRREIPRLFSDTELNAPEAHTLSLTVIDPQPRLEVLSSSLTQPSLMLLEGERRTFELKLKNASADVASDFLLLSSNDSVSKGLRETLNRKDLLPVDTYEVQHQLKYRPVVQVSDAHLAGQPSTGPQQVKSFAFSIWGRPGLSDASIHIDFAHLGRPHSEIRQTFYTRQARFPLSLTVNGSIDIVRCNVLSVQGSSPSTTLFRDKNDLHTESTGTSNGVHDTVRRCSNGVCMLTLDLRNVWPEPLAVELKSNLANAPVTANGTRTEDDGSYIVSETIQPGHINRVVLIVPRLFIRNPFAPIPNLDTKRQFVVSASKMSLEAEAATRENFWYREELLKHLTGTWKEVKTGRSGEIDLRKGIRLNLNARMIDVLRVDHVDLSYSLAPKSSSAETSPVKELEDSHYTLRTESFAILRVHVRNRSDDKLALLLRLQPSLRDQPHNVALDLSRRLAWSGVLQQVLHPPLEAGDERTVELGLVAFAEGLYDINATVEEVKPRRKTMADPSDGLGLDGHRRLWHARSPCQIDAADAPAST